MSTGKIRPYSTELGLLYRIIDAVIILAFLILLLNQQAFQFTQGHGFLAFSSISVFWLFADSFDLYRSWRTSSYLDQILTTFGAWLCAGGCVLPVFILFRLAPEISIEMCVYWVFIVGFLLCAWRGLFRMLLNYVRRLGYNTRSAIILPVNQSAQQLHRALYSNPYTGIRFLGFFDDRNREDEELTGIDVAGSLSDAVSMAERGEVDLVYIALPMKAEERISALLELFANATATISIVPNFFVFNLLHSRLNYVGDMLTLSVYDTPGEGVGGLRKRTVDLLLGSVFLVLAAIPMLVIAMLVKLTSAGPVIFSQPRYGLDGTKINVHKFRTMTVHDSFDEIIQAKKSDPRVTTLGAILRRFSLDELPQLLNVLKGNMSLVGPRPHAVTHNEQYRTLIRGYMLRHKVKPGITGWAQINGWRGETETLDKMENRIRCDLDYINRWSILFDLRILFLTIIRMPKMSKNSY